MVYGLFIYRYPAARWQKHPHLKSPFPPKKSFPFSAHAACSEGHRASTQNENTIIISWIRKLKVMTTQPSNGSMENHSWEDVSRTSILNPQTTSVYGIKPGAEGKHTHALTCAHTPPTVSKVISRKSGNTLLSPVTLKEAPHLSVLHSKLQLDVRTNWIVACVSQAHRVL